MIIWEELILVKAETIIYKEYSEVYPAQAVWLAEEPNLMLTILNEVAFDVLE